MTNSIALSKTQSHIVYAGEGPMYVQASAGSGKTRVLTERIRFCLKQTSKKVLALTFTNKAGEEIKSRLSDIPNLEQRVFIGTFHSFCQSILENHGAAIALSSMPHIFEDESDRLELIEQAIAQTPVYGVGYSSQSREEQRKFRYRVLEYISKVKRELLDVSDLSERTDNEEIVMLYQNYQDILRSQDAIDFDDIILQACKLLINFPKIASLYRRSFYSICIDESQDLNNAQYQLLKCLTDGEFDNILMVGDPNQSIYHFNGSSPKYMNELFVRDFNPEIIDLNENYRSSKSVLAAASKIITTNVDLDRLVVEGDFQLTAYQDEFEEALSVVDKIQSLVSKGSHPDIEGPVSFENIAVLARNKYVFKQLEEKLELASVPFNYKMNQRVLGFESDLMKIFDLAFRVKLNKNDELHKSRLLAKLDLKENSIDTLESAFSLIKNDTHRQVIKLVSDLKEDGSNIKKLLESFKDTHKSCDVNESSMVIHDINELINHWIMYAKSTNSRTLHQFKNAMALGQTHPNSDHKGVTLSTVHTMKGQEFDIVFVIGLDDSTFPDYRAIKSQGIDLLQEKNNLYVAFTRAKRLLFASYPQSRTMPWGRTSSRYVSRFLNNFEKSYN